MTRDHALILQVGTPRTGSTTAQRYLFPKLRGVIPLYKRPYVYHRPLRHEPASAKAIQALKAIPFEDWHDNHFHAALEVCINASVHYSTTSSKRELNSQLLSKCLELLLQLRNSDLSEPLPLFIASERLSNTDLAIDGCDRDHQLELPADSLARAFRGLTSHKGRIIVSACLRDPIPHLVSRYIRCQTNRRFAGQPTQDIGSYLEIQVSGYHRAEFDSALFPIVHKKFIGYHRSFAEVHAYGFAEINRSEDAFRTMGIGGQEIISYKELPRENAASMTKEDRTNLECQVRAKLAKLDFIREIEGNQLFE